MYIFNLAATYSLKLLSESRGKAFGRLDFSCVKIAAFSFIWFSKIKKSSRLPLVALGAFFLT